MNSLMGLSGAAGLQTSMRAFDRSATLVTTSVGLASDKSADPANAGGSLIDGLTGLDLAGVGIKANLAVMHTADEMLGSIIDLHA